MGYLISDIPALLRSPLGRLELRDALTRAAWPVLWPVAAAHRRGLGRSTKVVAVVGSHGKTTTTRAVRHALGLGAEPEQHTNCLGELAGDVLRCGRSCARRVLEVGISHPGQMRAYARMLCPDITVVTAVGSDHNRTLGSRETTRAEKSEMVACLPPDGLAVLNGDDADVLWMRRRARSRTVTFGFSPSCDIRAGAVALDWPHGMRFEVRTPQGTAAGRVRWLGRRMVYSALAAIAAGLDLGVPLDAILDRLAATPPVTGRLQLVESPGGVYVLRDDFKGGLETVHSALDALDAVPLPPARKWVVLGDISDPMGEPRAHYHAVGERVARIASFAVLVGENVHWYAGGLQRGGLQPGQIVNAGASIAPVAGLIRGRARPGDVVLVKGRGFQRMARVSLALLGRDVRCDLRVCHVKATVCDTCPALELPGPATPPPWGRSILEKPRRV